jgi:F-type H+-transporting ATPase subunit alpha
LDLSQYRELESFAAFASDLDATSKAQLDRGARLVELLKQPQYQPFPVNEQVVSLWMGTTGQIDDVPVEDVRRFEADFLDFVRRNHVGILDEIASTGQLSDETEESLTAAVTDFKRRFATSTPQDVNEAAADAIEDESQEKITRYRPAPPPEKA